MFKTLDEIDFLIVFISDCKEVKSVLEENGTDKRISSA